MKKEKKKNKQQKLGQRKTRKKINENDSFQEFQSLVTHNFHQEYYCYIKCNLIQDLVWFYGILTIGGYLMPNPVLYIYIYIYISHQQRLFHCITTLQCG